jgi:hypothetical protein
MAVVEHAIVITVSLQTSGSLYIFISQSVALFP